MTNHYGRATLLGALAGLVVGGLGGWYVGSQQAGSGGSVSLIGKVGPGMEATKAAGSSPKATAVVPAKYGFEADQPIGWRCGEYERALACTGVRHSSELRQQGASSLKFDVDLSGTSDRRSSGEIWVDVNQVPPTGHTGPVDLTGRTLVAWVYAMPGSQGAKTQPNGFQLFVKGKGWKAKYGPWQDVQEGQWAQVSFPVGVATKDFDPAEVNAIGLKFGSGEGSKEKFQGSIYVDAVSW